MLAARTRVMAAGVFISGALLPSDRLLQASNILLFFFNDTATTEIYTLSLHDALPISRTSHSCRDVFTVNLLASNGKVIARSEEHTSELQSRGHLVCRLLLEKKKN